ncbi:hypothetical protein HZA38_01775 [Candidatus Peregrinibacteria bacterium]|nr:hypothetical protein [Candidatus Peregrinibacteria bacterium]
MRTGGNATYRINPYDEKESWVGFGYINFGEGWLSRRYGLSFEEPKSADEVIKSLNSEFTDKSYLPQKTTINNFEVVKYMTFGLCNVPEMVVIGEKHNYRFTVMCGDSSHFPVFEDIIKSMKLFPGEDEDNNFFYEIGILSINNCGIPEGCNAIASLKDEQMKAKILINVGKIKNEDEGFIVKAKLKQIFYKPVDINDSNKPLPLNAGLEVLSYENLSEIPYLDILQKSYDDVQKKYPCLFSEQLISEYDYSNPWISGVRTLSNQDPNFDKYLILQGRPEFTWEYTNGIPIIKLKIGTKKGNIYEVSYNANNGEIVKEEVSPKNYDFCNPKIPKDYIRYESETSASCTVGSDCKAYCYELGSRGVISYREKCEDNICECYAPPNAD